MGEFVALWMSQDGDAAGAPYPADRGLHVGPARGNMAGLSRSEVAAEDVTDVGGQAATRQTPGKVGAGDHAGSCQQSRRIQDSADARLIQPRIHFLCAIVPGLPQSFQPGLQRRMLRVDAQADDVEGPFLPGDGNLDAGNQVHAAWASRLTGLRQPGGRVMVGQCKHLDADLRRAPHQFRGWVGPIRGGRVGVQIVDCRRLRCHAGSAMVRAAAPLPTGSP